MFSNNTSVFGGAVTTAAFTFGTNTTTSKTPFTQPSSFRNPTTTTSFGMFIPAFGSGSQKPPGCSFLSSSPGTVQEPGFGGNFFGQQQNSAFGLQKNLTGFNFAATTSSQNSSTAPVKFNPIIRTDTDMQKGMSRPIRTRIQCIVCMPQYETKSQEEIRWEDYRSNRKGPQEVVSSFSPPCSTAASSFGRAANKMVFGQTENQPLFGLESKPLFGRLENKIMFGQADGKPVFGQAETKPVFGQTENKCIFGQTESKPVFGQMESKPVSGQFTAPALTNQSNLQPTFVAGNASSSSVGFNLFSTSGIQLPSGTSMFGQTHVQNIGDFGNKPVQPMFNMQQTTAQSNLFQSKSTTCFRPVTKSHSTANLFSVDKQDSTASFVFGQQARTPLQPLQNSFGSVQSPPQQSVVFPAQFGFGSQMQLGNKSFVEESKPMFGVAALSNPVLPFAGEFMPHQQFPVSSCTMSEVQSQEDFHSIVKNVYELFPLRELFDGIPSKPYQENDATNPFILQGISQEALPIKSLDNKPKLVLITNPQQNIHANFLKATNKVDESTIRNNFQLHSPIKSLKLPSKVLSKCIEEQKIFKNMKLPDHQDLENVTHELHENLNKDGSSDEDEKSESGSSQSMINTVNITVQAERQKARSPLTVKKGELASNLVKRPYDKLSLKGEDHSENFGPSKNVECEEYTSKTHCQDQTTHAIETSLSDDKSGNFQTNKVNNDVVYEYPSSSQTFEHTKIQKLSQDKSSGHMCGIKLTRPDYYTIPPLNELHRYRKLNGECIVNGFTIGRRDYGSIHYPDRINIANLDLDEIVHFDYREVIIYPNDSNKPPLGEGLNRPAYITLDSIWPRHPTTRHALKDPEAIEMLKFVEHLAVLSKKQDAELVDYRPESGSWVFYVKHLSKFSYIDSDDEELVEKLIVPKEGQGKKSEEEEEKYCKQKNAHDVKTHEAGDQLILFKDINVKNNTLVKRSLFNKKLANDTKGPTLHQTLSQVRLNSVFKQDSRNIMAMKLSFFSEESVSNEANTSYLSVSPHPFTEHPNKVVCGLRRKPCEPRYYVLRNPSSIVPLNRSLLVSSSRNYMDMKLFKRKSFKVGWGLGFDFWMVVTPGLEFNSSVINKQPTTVLHMEVNSLSINPQMMILEKHLTIAFKESTAKVDDSRVPLLTVNESYSSLLAHQHVAYCTNQNHCVVTSLYKQVWDLCVAFWGPNAVTPTARRKLFSKWLEDATLPFSRQELELDDWDPMAVIKNIFAYLTSHRIEEAADLAMNAGMPRLAILISQSGQEESKILMRDQLKQWRDSGAIMSIDKDILKIYMLLAGIPYMLGINICENLEWKRALGVHFWYVATPGTSLIHSMWEYEKAFMLGYARPPSPEYYQKATEVYDLLYQIMMLFVTPTMPLERVVNLPTYTDDPVDYRLSWFLLQVLKSLKVGIVSQHVTNAIHISFSSQLEQLRLWKWSIFVLLFIKDKSSKTNAIIRVLERNTDANGMSSVPIMLIEDLLERNTESDKASVPNMHIEDSLVNDFNVPPEWIHNVLANKMNLMRKYVEAYNHLIFANKWCEAHNMAIDHLIPELISSGQGEKLFGLLKNLIPGKRDILRWHTQAGLVLDFLQLQREVVCNKEFVNETDIRWLESHLTNLCLRLGGLPSSSLKQIMVATEISRCLAFLLDILYTQLQSPNVDNMRRVVNLIKKLVMPPDYKQNELLKYVHHYLKIQ